jgi:hypothetical protein
MRKGALLLAVQLAACFTTTADAAKKKAAKAAPDPALAAQKNTDAIRRAAVNPAGAKPAAAAPAKKAKRAKKAKKKMKKAA